MNLFFSDPHGFHAKRRKTAEQGYASFMTDVSHLPKTLAMFSGNCCFNSWLYFKRWREFRHSIDCLP